MRQRIIKYHANSKHLMAHKQVITTSGFMDVIKREVNLKPDDHRIMVRKSVLNKATLKRGA